jgi:hypothetical protein
MNAELEAIRDSWDKETGDGRDEDGTRAMCDAYVAAHPGQFITLRGLSEFHPAEGEPERCADCGASPGATHPCQCVKALSVFRQAGMEEEQWKVEVWLLHHIAPQTIGGPIVARVRLPGTGA